MRKKPANYYVQSAVIPYRFQNNKLEILLITSLNKKNWIIPKGIIEEGLSGANSAAKEGFEEAGILGKVSDKQSGCYEYQKWGGTCKVQVFPFLVKNLIDNFPEAGVRERKWFFIDDAINQIKNNQLKIVLKKFRINFQDINAVK